MLVRLGERLMKIAALVVGLALIAGIASATELHGRWAVDPADCHSNRYVWVFADERAGLFVDNAVVSGWRRATYRPMADEIVTVAFDGLPRREFRWRFRGPDEISTAGVVEDGKPAETRGFQVWKRCVG